MKWKSEMQRLKLALLNEETKAKEQASLTQRYKTYYEAEQMLMNQVGVLLGVGDGARKDSVLGRIRVLQDENSHLQGQVKVFRDVFYPKEILNDPLR